MTNLLGLFFLTLGPVELVPSEPSKFVIESSYFFSLYVACILVIGGLVLHMKRDPLFFSLVNDRSFRPTRFFFLIFIFIVFIIANVNLAACDGRSNSPAVGLGFHFNPEGSPETGVPQGAPMPIEIPPEIPQLNQPLMLDDYRRVELQRRLSVYFIGRHDAAHLPQFLGILETQMQLEKKIEAALVHDGYHPLRVFQSRHEIRGILFNHPTRAIALSERTLTGYLSEINRNGTRQSIPYSRVVRAILNFDLSL